MITFKQHLEESMSVGYPYTFDTHVPASQWWPSRQHYIYTFKDGERPLKATFSVDSDQKKIIMVFGDKSDNHEITNDATSSIRVFATVANIARTMIEKFPGYGLFFAADLREKSRVRLYDTFAKRIDKTLKTTHTKNDSHGIRSYTFEAPRT